MIAPTGSLNKGVVYRPIGYRNVTDVIIDDTTITPPAPTIIRSTGSGDGSLTMVLSAVGVTTLSNTWASNWITKPRLPWLASTAYNFQEVRVTRATLVIASDVGSTTNGRITMFSSPDFADTLAVGPFGTVGVGGITASISGLQAKPLRVPLSVDTRWMKVSPRTLTLSGTNGLVIENAINDLTFSTVSMMWADCPINTNIAHMYLEYDVEFRHPIGAANNL